MENTKFALAPSRRLRRAGKRTVGLVATKGKQNIIVVAALIILVAIFAALNPNFVDKHNIVSMAQSLAPYAIMGLGVTFVIATGMHRFRCCRR